MKWAISAILIAVLALCAVISLRSRNTAAAATVGAGQTVTVLLDFSASFAPYSDSDQKAVGRVRAAIEELTLQSWEPPVTTIWFGIGTQSLFAPPLCAPPPFTPGVTLGKKAAQDLQAGLDRCIRAMQTRNAEPEGYTDISSAVVRAVRAQQNSAAKKFLIIFSDFKEDLKPGSLSTDIRMSGETIVMIHRPGTTETDMPAYLNRIAAWKSLFLSRGAGRVLDFPMSLMSANDIALLLDPHSRAAGTAVSVLVDSTELLSYRQSPRDRDLIDALGHQIATLAADWPPPVTVRIGVFGASALRMKWLAPIVYEPRFSPIPGRINLAKDFQSIIALSFATLPNLSVPDSTTDLPGALALATAGDQPAAIVRNVFMVSDFAGLPPGVLPPAIRGSHMILLYRPNSLDSGNTTGYYARIDRWQSSLKAAGTTANSFELATITTDPLLHCTGCFDSRPGGTK